MKEPRGHVYIIIVALCALAWVLISITVDLLRSRPSTPPRAEARPAMSRSSGGGNRAPRPDYSEDAAWHTGLDRPGKIR
jgi:hypothetical protein